jgi:thymidylate synthase (FAD)
MTSHSTPDNIIGVDDAQELIAYCARVSNPDNQNNKDTSEKLIKYLIKNQHWSPLEMVNACIEIETTRDIARQILRHRSFSFQEFSQRYADPTKELSFDEREARLQDPNNRQNSWPLDFDLQDEVQLDSGFRQKQREVWKLAVETYEWAIKKGIAKEQARVVLPEGNTVSRLYMNGTLRSWVHYIELRSAQGTQREHQLIAIACANELAKIFSLMNDYKKS